MKTLSFAQMMSSQPPPQLLPKKRGENEHFPVFRETTRAQWLNQTLEPDCSSLNCNVPLGTSNKYSLPWRPHLENRGNGRVTHVRA